MKKSLMILLGVALVLSMVGVGAVAAANQILNQGTPIGETTVVYDVSESYTVTIPDSVDMNTVLSIGSGAAIIDSEKYLNIYVSSTHSYNVVHTVDHDLKLNYSIAVLTGTGSPLKRPLLTYSQGAGQYLIYSVASGDIHSDNDLHIKLVDTVETAGRYEDTLTFTVKVETGPQFAAALATIQGLTQAANNNYLSV